MTPVPTSGDGGGGGGGACTCGASREPRESSSQIDRLEYNDPQFVTGRSYTRVVDYTLVGV